jgi:AGCS family alanine or glycine:cation symporter
VVKPRIFLSDALFTGMVKVDETGRYEAIPLSSLPSANPPELRGAWLQNGSPLTAWAFTKGYSAFGTFGYIFVTIGVFLFGISTAISWSYYGDRGAIYVFGQKAVLPYRLIYVAVHFIGAMVSLETVWSFGDAALGLMAIPNLITIALLSREVKKDSDVYFSKKHQEFRKGKHWPVKDAENA